MNANTWADATDLFHRALERPSDQRDAFLDTACAGRAALRHEVASLLAAHERSADFLEQPPAATATLTGIFEAPASLVGRTLGPYRVLYVLGAGGMGVVYAAEDTTLGRRVALKALPGRFTMDASRRARLRQEARAAAALNHPAIATVYALEEFEGRLYIAGEYLTGETLRDELRRGPLALPRLLETAIAIAGALEAAHAAGIIHRDLKPENVMRTATGDGAGTVKLLDFGLAQARDAAAGTALQTDGALLGTPGYMSPEQLLGQPLDVRSDHFALGVMLYELATGRHPFATADAATTIARVLTAEPAPLTGRSPFDAATGANLAAVIDRCLRKDASARFDTTRELAERLRAIRSGPLPPDTEAVTAPRVPAARAMFWWQFHQLASSAFASLLVVLLWFAARALPPVAGRVAFVAGLVAAIVTVTMRLHHWFTRRSFPDLWTAQFQRTRRWVQWADRLESAVLVASGLAAIWHAPEFGAGTIGGGVILLLASEVIEPITTAAAGRSAPPG
ncbi:MAG: serine/threonine-protein kinase [Vicinamibacterales bacterium]